VLAIVVEEEVVAQEASRLGIVVTPADVEAYYKSLDAQVRADGAKRGEVQTLDDVRKLQKMTAEEFRLRLEDQIRKERISAHPQYLGSGLPDDPHKRIAQIEVVIGELMKRAKVEREGLPAGVSIRVNGKPIPDERFGAMLEARLSTSEVRRWLKEYSLTILFGEEASRITDAQVEEEIEAARPQWQRAREEAVTPEMQTIDFETFLQMRFNAPVADLRTNPYRRGIFALRRQMRAAVTDEDVLKSYSSGTEGQYGASIVVTQIVVSFRAAATVAETVKRRAKDDALRLVRDFERRLKGGEPAETIEKEIKALGQRGVVFQKKLLWNRGNDLPLFPHAQALADGRWSEPIETMSEVTLLRRDQYRPAPSFEAVKPVVKEALVDERARSWVDTRWREQVQLGS
jgi:hypothetical protein